MLVKINRAQSIVEYLLVLTGIILATLWGASHLANKSKRQYQAAGSVLDRGIDVIEDKLDITIEEAEEEAE